MRDGRVLGLVAVGMAPLLVFGVPAFLRTVTSLDDACMTWGTSWDEYQEGGGSAGYDPDGRPLDPACPEGRSWTTQAPGHALMRTATLGAAGLIGLLAGLVAWRWGRPWPLIAVAPAVFVASFPLGLGATIVIAGLPAIALVGAARLLPAEAGERWALRLFGAVVGGVFVVGAARAAWAIVIGEMPPIALIGITLGGLQFVALAALALWPWRARGAAPRAASSA